jgi:hypothetical protein
MTSDCVKPSEQARRSSERAREGQRRKNMLDGGLTCKEAERFGVAAQRHEAVRRK